MADNKVKVLEALKKAGKPMRPADIVTATGLPKEEVAKLLKELKKEGKITSPKACFYAPAGK
ncbi:MAG: helix-turn-helix domain-containing protein [candidate division KSB1 bacterium]|nr:helix-turn-helix domain-containing protein [candidate division KSB1 bacterium]MDZ7337934.1 helix-turn-helix domain-containing protein [candidate division KSB1 bacterium]MDZ7386472.1 helix-turn-helix domain-containing protein [candidate division KSB1 bacterium]MDZ7392033.1 helix-turn-helix domain-containing protein [candidate division KSB1 bacterium]MDZ7414433.1 helix-turn-helix domain-containing protein [candidate division KSB1 bacterium]